MESLSLEQKIRQVMGAQPDYTDENEPLVAQDIPDGPVTLKSEPSVVKVTVSKTSTRLYDNAIRHRELMEKRREQARAGDFSPRFVSFVLLVLYHLT